MAKDKEAYMLALAGKKLPILALDHKWHQLFTQTGDNEKLLQLEEVLKEHLKRESKINTELKSLATYKKQLMQEIVEYMDLPEGSTRDSVMEEKKRLIEEVNQKMEDYKDELLDLPREIDSANIELMLATMEVCYNRLQKNTADIEAINQWIKEFRVQLKKQVIKKQQKEIWNDELYSYMHAIFGPDVIDLFDLKYDPSKVRQKEEAEVPKTTDT